jgi:hypothetical protein
MNDDRVKLSFDSEYKLRVFGIIITIITRLLLLLSLLFL